MRFGTRDNIKILPSFPIDYFTLLLHTFGNNSKDSLFRVVKGFNFLHFFPSFGVSFYWIQAVHIFKKYFNIFWPQTQNSIFGLVTMWKSDQIFQFLLYLIVKYTFWIGLKDSLLRGIESFNFSHFNVCKSWPASSQESLGVLQRTQSMTWLYLISKGQQLAAAAAAAAAKRFKSPSLTLLPFSSLIPLEFQSTFTLPRSLSQS